MNINHTPMTYTEIETYLRDLFILNGYDPFKIEFYYTKEYAGCFNPNTKTITISMFAVEKLTDDQLKDVLLHEFAHFFAYKEFGENNHEYYWQECCKLLGCSTDLTVYFGEKK